MGRPIKKIKKIYYYIIIIAIIMLLIFLGQRGYFDNLNETLFIEGAFGYWAKGTKDAVNNTYSTLSDEAQKRGEIIKEEINSEKENISKNVLQKVGDYFSGIANSIAGKNSCEVLNQSSVDQSN